MLPSWRVVYDLLAALRMPAERASGYELLLMSSYMQWQLGLELSFKPVRTSTESSSRLPQRTILLACCPIARASSPEHVGARDVFSTRLTLSVDRYEWQEGRNDEEPIEQCRGGRWMHARLGDMEWPGGKGRRGEEGGAVVMDMG